MKMRFEIEMDTSLEGDRSKTGAVIALLNFLQATQDEAGTLKTAAKRQTAAKTNPTPTPVTAPTPTQTANAPTPAAVNGPTISDVRMALAQKVEAHRDEIKTRLSELGAQNVSTLDPGKYAEMMDFLNSLK